MAAQSTYLFVLHGTGRVLGACALLCLLLFAGGCNRTPEVENDFQLAEVAYEHKEIADAEMHYERFLRKNQENEKRWYVWQRLLDIALNFRQEKRVARSYLEIMLEEFASDPLRKRIIQIQLADVAASLKEYSRAITLWESLVAEPQTPAEEKAAAYISLSGAYLRRLDFTLATEALELCLELPVKLATKVECQYELATAEALTDNLPKAEKTLESLISMPEINEEHLVLGLFALADVYEQQEKFAKAKALYESIRETYPNQQVIAMRILDLEKKVGKR